MILKLREPSSDFIVPFSDGVSFLTFERRQNQRKAHLYQISISQVITPWSMALMTIEIGPASGTRICPPIAAFPFVFTEKDYDALSSVIYNLYAYDHHLYNK